MAKAEEAIPSLEMRGCGFLFAYHVGVLEYVLDNFSMSVPATSKGAVASRRRIPVRIRATSAASFPVVIWAANGERPLSWMMRDWPRVHEFFRIRPLAFGAICGAKEFFRELWLRNLKDGSYESLNRAADACDRLQTTNGVVGESTIGNEPISSGVLRKRCVEKQERDSGMISTCSSQSTMCSENDVESSSSEHIQSSSPGIEEDDSESSSEQEASVPNPGAACLELTLTTNDMRLHAKRHFSSNEDLVDALLATTHIPGIFRGFTRVEGLGICWDGALGSEEDASEPSSCAPVVIKPYYQEKAESTESTACCARRRSKDSSSSTSGKGASSAGVDIYGKSLRLSEFAFPSNLDRCMDMAREGYADAKAKHDVFVERGWIELEASAQRTKSSLAA